MNIFDLCRLFSPSKSNPPISPRAPVIQCYVYGFSGVILGVLTLIVVFTADETLNSTIRISSELGAVGLMASALLSLKAPFCGRVGAIFSLFGLGYLWFPMVFLLVPRPEFHVPLHIYLSILLYFITVFFALFYPRLTRFTLPIFILISAFLIFFVGLLIAASE